MAHVECCTRHARATPGHTLMHIPAGCHQPPPWAPPDAGVGAEPQACLPPALYGSQRGNHAFISLSATTFDAGNKPAWALGGAQCAPCPPLRPSTYGGSAAHPYEINLSCPENLLNSPDGAPELALRQQPQDRDADHAARARGSAQHLLHTAQVSVYTDATSPDALRTANLLMCRLRLPGKVPYLPVPEDSALQQVAVAWHFPAMAVCLASSYFQRLMISRPQLAAVAAQVPSFQMYCVALPAPPAGQHRVMDGGELFYLQSTLRSIMLTCLFLATKVADQLHARGLLMCMLNAIAVSGTAVSDDEAWAIELRCLEGLDWRLGPFFAEDCLANIDAGLWARA